MKITLEFVLLFVRGIYFATPVLSALFLSITLIGQVVGRREGWSKFDAFYWSFITAITVGYGDFHPRKRLTKLLAILIALTGVLFTGIIVAIALHAAQTAFGKAILAT